ncbi:MFS transporter [Odoribacter lunatus]|uniref:MFS transporter n=1 Tax=Odoribacter lunatus TaxID=2941335 RepID=UPI00204051A4|nr:MFS transporter [Odoribacter lunatus]
MSNTAISHILVSLKSRNFRLYFTGMCVSLTGTWMQQIAMSWLVYKLTNSVLLLATVTFTAQIPILLATPFMSVFVDRFNRHKILLVTQTLSALQALLLAWLTLSGLVEVWHLIALSLFIGLINALDNPTRQAFYPSLVPKENLSNAIALNSAVINGSRLFGPAIGGVLIGLISEGICFLFNGISYLGVIIALLVMKLPSQQARYKQQHLLYDLKEGFQYVSHHLPIRTLLTLMTVISFFGLPLITFLPAYVKDILGGGSELLGILLSCIGVGSFSAAIYLAARKSVAGLPKVIMLAALILGCTLLLLSFIEIPWMAAVVCIPAGYSIIITVASINTLLQTLSDEDKRGRVMGYLAMTFTGIAPIGSMILGFIEKYTGLPVIILISGIACLLAGSIFEYYRPRLCQYSRSKGKDI